MIFWLAWALVGFNCFGYIFILSFLSVVLPAPYPPPPRETEPLLDAPDFFVLVPTWNEATLLREKVLNLLAQIPAGPEPMILLCDGGSTDGSRESIRDLLGASVRWLDCPTPGKVAQLNFGLQQVPPHGLVAVTDADSRIRSEHGLALAAHYLAQPGIGLVGGWSFPGPGDGLVAEHAYWDKQNRLRYLETCAGSSSIVTAQFYIFRKSLLSSFPINCVADDIHVSIRAHAQGLRVLYAHDIEAVELRQPNTQGEFVRHKFRKANAYMMELLRALPWLPYMKKRQMFLLLFKVLQFVYMPWIFLLFLGLSVRLAFYVQWAQLGAAYASLLAGTLAASAAMVPPPGKRRGGLSVQSVFPTLYVFILLNIILMANSLSFPFWRQNSRYRRVS